MMTALVICCWPHSQTRFSAKPSIEYPCCGLSLSVHGTQCASNKAWKLVIPESSDPVIAVVARGRDDLKQTLAGKFVSDVIWLATTTLLSGLLFIDVAIASRKSSPEDSADQILFGHHAAARSLCSAVPIDAKR